MADIVIQFKMSPEMFDAIALFIKPNTKAGHILYTFDTQTDPVAALAGGLLFSQIINNNTKDGKAYQSSIEVTEKTVGGK